MAGKHIDTVFVDVLPDLSKAAASAEKQLTGVMKDVEKSVDKSAKEIEKSIEDAFQDAAKVASRELNGVQRKIQEVDGVIRVKVMVDGQEVERVIKRDVHGRLRDERGRFVTDGELLGLGLAEGMGKSISGSALEVLGGSLRGVFQKLGPYAIAAGALIGTQLAGGIAPAAAGLAAALPAAIGVAGAAVATLTLGLQGLGDALDVADDTEKFNEALKNLSPSAAGIAKELRSLIPAFKQIRNAAQEGLFSGFQGQITQLISVIQRPLKDGLNDVGVALQMIGREFISFLTSANGVEVINEIFKTTAVIFAGLAPAIKPLADGISDLIIAAQPFIQELSRDFAGFLQRVGEGLTRLAESGDLDRFFGQAIISLETLGRIGENLFPILIGLFSALAPAGEDFLALIEELTANLALFLSDQRNVEALAAAFRALGFALTLNLRLFVIFAEGGRLIGEALNSAGEATEQLTGSVQSFGQTTQLWFKIAFDSVQSVIGAISNAPNALLALQGRFYSAGVSIIRSFFGGLSSAGSFAGNLASSVYNALKSGLNSAISRINSAISGLDSALPVSFPRIPMLARGGIAMGPAIVGEAGPEMALPLAGQRGQQAFKMIAEAANSAPSIVFESGSIAVGFEGVVPTEAEAFMTGQAVGRGITAVLERRDVRMQVRRS